MEQIYKISKYQQDVNLSLKVHNCQKRKSMFLMRDPTRVNKADVVRKQNWILLSMYCTGIMNHFDKKIIILIPFSIQRYEKNIIVMLEFQKLKNPYFEQ